MRTLFIAALLLAGPGLAQAYDLGQSSNRGDSWEWTFAGIYQNSDKTGAEGGSKLEVDSALGLGFNFSYNFTDHLALGGDIEWLRPDYKATLVSATDPADVQVIDHSMSQWNFRFKGTYNLLTGPLTPYVEAGLGWTNIDSNVLDGPPTTGCWWHPWWGYVCSDYYSTYTETPFSYGGAVGVRYALPNGTILKFSYNDYRLDSSGPSADPHLSAFRLEFGWRF